MKLGGQMKYNFPELIKNNLNTSDYKVSKYYKGEFIVLKECTFLILNKGKVAVEIINDSFNNFKVTDISSGEIIAPLFKIEKLESFLIEIVANEDIEIFEVERDVFFEKLLTDSDHFSDFFQYMAEKTTVLFQKVLLSTMTIEEKFLNYLQNNKDENSFIEINMSMTELSKELLITRTALYKVINKLIDNNILTKISSKKFKMN